MFRINYNLPTRIVFERGSLNKVGKEVRDLGKKAFVVTTRGGSMKRFGYLDRLTRSLEKEGINTYIYSNVSTNPTSDIAREAVEQAEKWSADFFIGLGGGSAIDVAKVAAASLATGIHPRDFTLGVEKVRDALPVVAIPTTHGTGTEVNHYAVLTDPKTKAKRGISGKALYPKISILDPEITLTLPLKLSLATTIDALSHALESYGKSGANRLSMMCSEEALRTIWVYGPLLRNNLEDIEVREHLLWASMMAGIAIDIAGAGLAHGLEHPMSALFNVHHGEGLAALTVEVAKFTRPVVKERYARLALLLSNPPEYADIDDLSWIFIGELDNVLDNIGLKPRLRDFGIKREEIDLLVENAWSFTRYNLEGNPRPATKEDARRIYLAVL